MTGTARVHLIRTVNVGETAKLPMAELRALAVSLGAIDVSRSDVSPVDQWRMWRRSATGELVPDRAGKRSRSCLLRPLASASVALVIARGLRATCLAIVVTAASRTARSARGDHRPVPVVADHAVRPATHGCASTPAMTSSLVGAKYRSVVVRCA